MKLIRAMTRAVLVGALALAACGPTADEDDTLTLSEDTGKTRKADQPTRADYLQGLDALCKRSDDESADAEQRIDDAAERDDSDEMIAAIDEVLDKRDEYMGAFDDIAVPSSEQEFNAKYKGIVERGYTLLGLFRDAVEAHEISKISDYADEIRDTADQRDALLDGHGGFEHCGSDDR